MSAPPPQDNRWSAARRAAYEKRKAVGHPSKPWQPIRPDDEPFFTVSHAEREAMYSYLDSLESLLMMIGQRGMDREQVDRLAMLLQHAELDLLARCTTSAAPARRTATVSSSTRSRSRAAA